VKRHRDILSNYELCATGTTGTLVEEELGRSVRKFESPLGGDQQIGARIAEGEIDFLIFFWDPVAPHPHDPDVTAPFRIAVVWNIPFACNHATADFMIDSPLTSTNASFPISTLAVSV
jgi:methylglyoxal synthase